MSFSPAIKSSCPGDMAEDKRQTHLSFMREALSMAELALNTNETPVGCVLVHQSRIIGRGMNATNRSYNGTRHAEFMAISAILSRSSGNGSGSGEGESKMYQPSILGECDLYVTVEPCIMCASLLRQFGIRKVYFGASNEKFGGTGGVLNVHRANGKAVSDGEEEEEGDYEVSGGWLKEEAIGMLQRFYMQENQRAPEPKARGKKDRALGELEAGEARVVSNG